MPEEEELVTGGSGRSPTLSEFNGEMFRLARQFRDLTQKEFAVAISAEPSTISRIENGLIAPSEDLALRASQKLNLPVAFFSQPEKVYGLPISVHPMWRRKAAVSQRDIDVALAGMNMRLLHVRRLMKSFEFEPVLSLPQFDVESHDGDTQKIATLVRRAWQMPNGPVDDLTAWVERAGCFVIHVQLPDAAMDGVTLRSPDLPPCIFLNKSLPADRMRFTLAHELGHLIMHRYPTQDMETEANAFAGQFLVPSDDIQPYFRGRRIDLRLLASLKPEWKVAMQSLLYRAKELGHVDSNQARYLWQQFNRLKIRMREPAELDFPQEVPTLAPRMLNLHLEQLDYSVADLEKVVNMYETEIPTFHNLNPGKLGLRLVS